MNKIIISIATLFIATGAHAGIIGASQCKLASAPVNAPDWQSQAFPLIQASDGYEAAASMGSSSIFELKLLDPADLQGWPNYGGNYYSGGNDMWVIVTSDGNTLSGARVIKVIKPLEADPNTNERPATYICAKSI